MNLTIDPSRITNAVYTCVDKTPKWLGITLLVLSILYLYIESISLLGNAGILPIVGFGVLGNVLLSVTGIALLIFSVLAIKPRATKSTSEHLDVNDALDLLRQQKPPRSPLPTTN